MKDMKKVILKLTLVAAFVVSAGYSLYTSQVNEDLSDLALANIEALAGGESIGRDDCMPAPDLCSMIVIYPDGDYGEDMLINHTKKPGWI